MGRSRRSCVDCIHLHAPSGGPACGPCLNRPSKPNFSPKQPTVEPKPSATAPKEKTGDIKVTETKREVYFAGGRRAVFNDVEWFNSNGSFLRLQAREGYVLLNTANIDYMVVDGDRVR